MKLSLQNGYLVLPTGERVARVQAVNETVKLYFWSKKLKREVPVTAWDLFKVLLWVREWDGMARPHAGKACRA